MNTAQKPWSDLSFSERMTVYQDAALRIHDIDWYQFHGIDRRQDTSGCASPLWCSARNLCLRTVAKVAG